ncbi:MAG: PaaI family thioesterase [Chloroflexi bacterium]|nr:PaaI family thioesterase [Chloroflexota bacterium]MDA1239283.1 PaaI family thioesterase [Chloroflexota bacterium]
MTTPPSDHDWLAHPRAMKSEIYDHLGFDITDGGEGWVEVTLQITPVVMNADGVVHGGIWLVVADSAMGGAVRSMIERNQRAVTSQSDFRWLRPLQGDSLRAVGRVLRRGRQVWHTTVECFDDGGGRVGTGGGTFVVIDRE